MIKLSSRVFLLSAACLAAISFCLYNGFRLEQKRIDEDSERKSSFVNAEQVVSFDALDFQGSLSPSKKWKLMVFTRPDCHYCGDEFRALQTLPQSVRSRLEIINVVTGAASSQMSHGANFPVALDREGRTALAYGSTGITPYSVLLDPSRKVKHTFNGFLPVGKSSMLAKDLEAFFSGRRTGDWQLVWNRDKIKALPPVSAKIVGGRSVSLANLSKTKVVVVVAAQGDPLSRAKLQSLRRFYAVPYIEFVCLNLSDNGVPLGDGKLMEFRWDQAKHLAKALEISKPEQAPSAVIVFDNRVLLREEGPNSEDAIPQFNANLSQIALLSQPFVGHKS